MHSRRGRDAIDAGTAGTTFAIPRASPTPYPKSRLARVGQWGKVNWDLFSVHLYLALYIRSGGRGCLYGAGAALRSGITSLA